jgi:hypothetical protein
MYTNLANPNQTPAAGYEQHRLSCRTIALEYRVEMDACESSICGWVAAGSVMYLCRCVCECVCTLANAVPRCLCMLMYVVKHASCRPQRMQQQAALVGLLLGLASLCVSYRPLTNARFEKTS